MSNNFTYRLLVLLLLISLVVWGSDAFTKASINSANSLVEEHIIQLNRISSAHGELLTQLQQQISDNQADIDFLRGQIQENQYQLNQIINCQKQLLLKKDQLSNSINLQPSLEEKGNIDCTEIHNENANSDYNKAISLVQDKSHQDEAISMFQYFLKKYPDSIYQSDANYWLGQLNYNKGKKDDAAYYFSSIVRNYPKSPKASEAMYKVGVIMQDRGDIAKAKAVYQQVLKKYPETNDAKQAKRRLSLMG